MDFIFPADEELRGEALANIIRRFHALAVGKDWRVTVVEWRATRSNQQNRYLYGVAYKMLSEATGYSVDDIATYCLGRHFGFKEVDAPKHLYPNGKKVPVRTTTTNELGERDVLGWDEFWDLVESVQQLGSENGVVIPDPDPKLRKDRKAA